MCVLSAAILCGILCLSAVHCQGRSIAYVDNDQYQTICYTLNTHHRCINCCGKLRLMYLSFIVHVVCNVRYYDDVISVLCTLNTGVFIIKQSQTVVSLR